MIDGIGGIGSKAPVARSGATRGTGAFRLPDAQAAASGPAVADISGVMLSGMLALQSDASGEVEDREARRRGHDLLGALAELQRGLLSEADPAGSAPDPARMQRLETLVRAVPRAADRGLRDVVAAIALRARIEAARLEVISEKLAFSR